MISPRLAAVDAVHVAHAFAVFRILSVGDVNTIFVNHRRADHFVASLRPNGIFRIGIKLPEFLSGELLRNREPSRHPGREQPGPRRRSCPRSAKTIARAGCLSLTELSSHASLPVFLLTAMIAGDFGEGTLT